MELIDKSDLVAEIKKEIKWIYASREYVGIPAWEERIIEGLNKTIEIINTLEVKGELYVVTRSEEHCDYVEAVFLSENEAEEYCNPFNEDEDSYNRHITKMKIL